MDTMTDQRKEAGQPAGEALEVSRVRGSNHNEKPGSDETRGRGVAAGQTFSGRRADGSIWGADGMCLSPAIDSDSGRELTAHYNRTGAYTGD